MNLRGHRNTVEQGCSHIHTQCHVAAAIVKGTCFIGAATVLFSALF